MIFFDLLFFPGFYLNSFLKMYFLLWTSDKIHNKVDFLYNKG